uniref:Uncharacterized protein n=1 Tax=Romanomermis culicivorax TaxID=13658 RepID=A0A915K2V7_ROMCU
MVKKDEMKITILQKPSVDNVDDSARFLSFFDLQAKTDNTMVQLSNVENKFFGIGLVTVQYNSTRPTRMCKRRKAFDW